MNVAMDLRFPHAFDCEFLDEQPSGALSPHYYYPDGTQEGGRDGTLIRVTPHGSQSWVGTFAFGRFGADTMTRIVSMPDRERICVVSSGAGYVVSVCEPESWSMVTAIPVTDVRPLVEAGVVVFASLTDLVAYGPSGLRWQTKRLAWDRLRLTDVTADRILGEYWDIRSEEMATFEVDPRTGEHHGGVED